MSTSKRGFASISVEKRREIASKGGKAAHQKGTAHEWTSEEAREAGRLLKAGGFAFDFVYTSLLKRAITTANLAPAATKRGPTLPPQASGTTARLIGVSAIGLAAVIGIALGLVAGLVAGRDFTWDDAPDAWRVSLSELAAMMVADWPELGLAT